MMTIVSGVGFLLLTLAVFSLFSLKFPKGSEAMSGMANAAVASFLIEAVHKYITGDLLGIAFLAEVGSTAGSLGGVAAGVMVPICMGANPCLRGCSRSGLRRLWHPAGLHRRLHRWPDRSLH